jgi:hypothetical protein
LAVFWQFGQAFFRQVFSRFGQAFFGSLFGVLGRHFLAVLLADGALAEPPTMLRISKSSQGLKKLSAHLIHDRPRKRARRDLDSLFEELSLNEGTLVESVR